MARKFGIFALFLLVASFLQAQTTSPANKQKVRPQPATEEMMDKEDTQMEGDLNLTPEQKAKFKQINQDYKNKMKSARADQKAEMQKYRDERRAAHKALLNEEQARKYDEKMAARDAKRAEKTNNKGSKGKGKGKGGNGKGKGKGKSQGMDGAQPDKDQKENQ